MKQQELATETTPPADGDHWAQRASWLGQFPCPPTAKRCKVVRPADKVTFLQGEKPRCLVDLFVSSDTIHFGIFYVPPFQAIDASAPHPGDECYYILEGDGVVLVEDAETYEVKKGDAFYLPAGLKHQWMNFAEKRLDVLWAIAPRP
jgi:mannose-6-phosphate isomerase-like protein (cupin superfamily)